MISSFENVLEKTVESKKNSKKKIVPVTLTTEQYMQYFFNFSIKHDVADPASEFLSRYIVNPLGNAAHLVSEGARWCDRKTGVCEAATILRQQYAKNKRIKDEKAKEEFTKFEQGQMMIFNSIFSK